MNEFTLYLIVVFGGILFFTWIVNLAVERAFNDDKKKSNPSRQSISKDDPPET